MVAGWLAAQEDAFRGHSKRFYARGSVRKNLQGRMVIELGLLDFHLLPSLLQIGVLICCRIFR